MPRPDLTPDHAMRECARRLGRALIFFDLETTGANPSTDRIVEIAVARATPDVVERRRYLVNPGIPIPAGATEVHGICDDDVRDAPPFRRLARGCAKFFEGAAIVAFNGLRFDMPLLESEMRRADVEFDAEAFDVVDPKIIFHEHHPRDLTTALRVYCDAAHEGAHGAVADIDATARVLAAQLDAHELPQDATALARACLPADAVDRGGWFAWRDGEAVVTRTKNAGTPLRSLDRGFLDWMLRLADLPNSTRRVVEDAKRGVYPTQATNDDTTADEGRKAG